MIYKDNILLVGDYIEKENFMWSYGCSYFKCFFIYDL